MRIDSGDLGTDFIAINQIVELLIKAGADVTQVCGCGCGCGCGCDCVGVGVGVWAGARVRYVSVRPSV